MKQSSEIAECVRKSLERYFKDLDGETAARDLRHGAEERREADARDGADTRPTATRRVAAEMLGINRNTLRKKMQRRHQGGSKGCAAPATVAMTSARR